MNLKIVKWLWVSILFMVLDFVSKSWIRSHFVIGEIFSISPFINICCVNNAGLVFGIFSDVSIRYCWLFIWFLILMIAIFFLVVLYRLYEYSNYHNVAFFIIIGGALGNIFDRIKYGVVLDFIDVHIKNVHWPIFNIADIEICIGFFMLLYKSIYKK